MDEELLRGRVYGTDHDDPNPGLRPGRDYAELVGGPLDGLLLDITGWTADEIQTGIALMTELGPFGAGGRAQYEARGVDRGRLRTLRRPGVPELITSRGALHGGERSPLGLLRRCPSRRVRVLLAEGGETAWIRVFVDTAHDPR